ncbi:hypothetical protein BBJ28_00000200 [Nothophytophthora sp. Chile5]|nr:hypothetical protein BBJ28_00000200 [Nothophytophthora sp. Chile5]
MSEEDADLPALANGHGVYSGSGGASPDGDAWSTSHRVGSSSHRNVARSVRTTEKSVVFSMRMEEQHELPLDSRGNDNARERDRLDAFDVDVAYTTSTSSTSSNGGSKRVLSSGVTQNLDNVGNLEGDGEVHETLMELYASVDRERKWLNQEEETFQRGQEHAKSLQREYATLVSTLEQCENRKRQRARIQRMLHGPRTEDEEYESRDDAKSSSDCDSDSDESRGHKHRHRGERSHQRRSRHDGAKKERKRLRRFQSDVSLRFQLLQSECRRTDLQVEKMMAELRREYADSCLFGSALSFQ